jgi:hypothetical protein
MRDHTELREIARDLIEQACLANGLHAHLAEVLDVHPSSINNALNGPRSRRRELELLAQLIPYLRELRTVHDRRKRRMRKVA